VTPEYHETMGIRLLAGRWLAESDQRGSDAVAVVSRAFANTFLGGASPIGLRIRPFYQGAPVTVVGLVETTVHHSRMVPANGEVYVPVSQVPENRSRSSWTFLVRTRDAPQVAMPAIRDVAASVDRAVAVPRLETIEQLLSRDVDLPRMRTVLFASFGGLALLLAGLGVYGVAHYGAMQRTQEIGIRKALGAGNRHVILLVIRQSMSAVLAGLAIGFAGALALTQLLAKLLFEVTPHDPVAFAAIVVVVLAVTLAASYLPARRAAAIDPVTALRYQ
jgi:putative ABC transport system permease protein